MPLSYVTITHVKTYNFCGNSRDAMACKLDSDLEVSEFELCFILWSAGTAKATILHILFFSCCCSWLSLNKSWRQHPTRHQLYSHLLPITKTIQVRQTRHAGHCWRSKDELISDVLLWNPAYGQAKAGRPARTYIQQLCEDTGCNPEDLPKAMNDREKWRERVRDIRAGGTWWWWWL